MKFRRRPTPTAYMLIAIASVVFASLGPSHWVAAESEAVVLAQALTDPGLSE